MTRSRAILAALAVPTAVALCLTGCGSSGGPVPEHSLGKVGPGDGGSTGAGGHSYQGAGSTPGQIVFHAKIETTGKVTLTDSYVGTIDPSDDPDAPRSCADVAKKGTSTVDGDGTFSVPTPDNDGALQGGKYSLGFDVGVGAYTGPKSYTGDDVVTDIGLELSATAKLSDDDSEDSNFGPPEGADRKVVVNPDGSGSFIFAKWINPGSEELSGSITWTCSG